MTEATQIVPIRPSSPLHHSEAQGLAAEVAKCLKLVAPSTMGAEQQTVWLHAAVDALQDIHPHEVANISAELRRSVTRPAQIVPEIAKLVSEKRQRARVSSAEPTPAAAGRDIHEQAQARRGVARNQDEVEAAWRWERSAMQDAGLSVDPIAKPLSADEIERLPGHVVRLGLSKGFLVNRGGQIIDAA